LPIAVWAREQYFGEGGQSSAARPDLPDEKLSRFAVAWPVALAKAGKACDSTLQPSLVSVALERKRVSESATVSLWILGQGKRG